MLEGTWKDVNFLADYADFIEELVLKNDERSVAGVEKLTNLRSLAVPFTAKNDIDFRGLQRLERCQVYWRTSYGATLFSVAALRELTVHSFPGRDLADLGDVGDVASLSLVGSSLQNLNGIRSFRSLQQLKLDGATKLVTFDGIQDAQNLSELWVDHAEHVSSCAAIQSCFGLRKITLISVSTSAAITLDQRFDRLLELGVLGEPQRVDWESMVRLPALVQFAAFVHSDSIPDRRDLESACRQAGKTLLDLDIKGARKTPMIVIRIAPEEKNRKTGVRVHFP